MGVSEHIVRTKRVNMELSGQIAIVTGAGRGLGRAFATALAGAGAHVVVTSRSELDLSDVVKSIGQSGGAATAIVADVTDRTAVDGLVARVEQQVGPIDLLINNAGAGGALGRMAEVDPDEWWRDVEINLRGPHLYMRAVLPHMIGRHRGRIINVASNAGLHAVQNTSAYSVSKTALIRLTEIAARETQAQGVTIFVIHPGDVHTQMWDNLSQHGGQRAPNMVQYFQELEANDRWTPIEDSVALVLLLASGQADPLTGCYLSVEDDVPALVQQADMIQKDGRRKLSFRE